MRCKRCDNNHMEPIGSILFRVSYWVCRKCGWEENNQNAVKR